MEPSVKRDRIAVIGMGNLLMKDDGVGVHALVALREQWRGRGLEWVDGGTDAWHAMWQATHCRRILILDAVHGGGLPGSIYRLSLDALEVEDPGVSLHDVSLAHLIYFEDALGNQFDSVRIVAMEPAEIAPGMELSGTCQAALPDLLRAAKAEIYDMQEQQNLQGAQQC